MKTLSTGARSTRQTAYELIYFFLTKREVNHTDKKTCMEQIRNALLLSLELCGAGEKSDAYLKVSDASEIEQLWYLRADVMAVIAKERGEAAAKSELGLINERFRGVLPKGLMTRPSPLQG